MIKPTIGRVVWFHPGLAFAEANNIAFGDPEQPLAATIAFVINDQMVNLSAVDQNGKQFNVTSVPLMQDDTDFKISYYCEWMPYQKEQAKLDVSLKTGIDTLLTTRIPILDQIYDLCQSIEKCGASPELTEAVTKAGALRDPISELVKQALALGIGQGIVAVSHSDEVKASVCLAEMSEAQLFGEIKPQDPSELPELKVANTGDKPPINGLASGCCSGNVRDERLSNRENTYMLTQVLATKNISQELRDKAEKKLSELLDKIN